MTDIKQSNQEQLTSQEGENHLIAERREKLNKIRSERKVAFPNAFRKESDAAEIHQWAKAYDRDALKEQGRQVKVAGRIMARRLFGRGGFLQLRDYTGDIQIFVNTSLIGKEAFEDFKTWDIGDIIGVEGEVSRSDKGELTIRAGEMILLTKSLRPLPDKFHGLTDIEARYRQRYLDLIMNQEVRETFRKRNLILRTIRTFMDERGFEEVETPMMHPIPGGANAKPFITHHNALDMEFYLRIAPELYLKRLIVGGMEKVYEINRNFRNEGVSTRHNPEFTMMEWYWAYADYIDMMDMTDAMMQRIAEVVAGSLQVEYQGVMLDFSKPAQRMTVQESINHYFPESKEYDLESREGVAALADKIGIKYEERDCWGKIIMEIFDEKVEAHLMQPTFITGYPLAVSPLARQNDDNPLITDRFEYFIGGREVGNGFSELNDAEDQHERFMAQVADKDSGDDEAMHYDKDFVTALEYGMPPTAGEGLGIDRLVMIFTDSASIRDVLLFPHMRSVE